ncbi:MAG: AAA family ATPase [Candidatus Calescibacterium sp.]|nr:AAA family ATPase [Candidatus Calescibacterium sp.]MCX7733480.1 AAA family ATPase [bacterium]MDW8087402.1 ArsA-related P-loop ATPase [Candidatus Calescibacterium sp.]
MRYGAETKNSRLIFLVGPGGVGKTTMSAAIGFVLRKFGKTIVITIDPAKRLKSALSIPIDGMKQIKENLFVTQVDKENEFRKFAFENNIGDITRTKLFEIAADLLPSEEYSAILKIIDIYENNNFDFVVVDTPPSLKFLNFLDAPGKIKSMFETGSVRYFLEIVATAGKRVSLPLSIAGKLFGSNFIVDFAKFLSSLKGVFDKMEEVYRKSVDLLSKSIIIAVASPYDRKIDELSFMLTEIKKRKLDASAIIINRFVDFTENGIPSNSPQSILNFHKNLVNLSRSMKDRIKETEKFRAPLFVIKEKFVDINSQKYVESISREIADFVSGVLKLKS